MPGERYLKKTRRRFDAIIDDMWLPKPCGPKTLLADPRWIYLINKRLRPGGMYAVNLYRRRENPVEIKCAVERLKSLFPLVREIRPSFGPTTVVAAGFSLQNPREVRSKMRCLPEPLASGLRRVSFLSL